MLLVKTDHKFASSGLQTELCSKTFWQPSGIVYFELKDWDFISSSLNHALPVRLLPFNSMLTIHPLLSDVVPSALPHSVLCAMGTFQSDPVNVLNRAGPLSTNPHISIAKSFQKLLPSEELDYWHVSLLRWYSNK